MELGDQRLQEELFGLLSDILEPFGFALGGSGAIREWGLIDRPTEDLDFTTDLQHEADVGIAANVAAHVLQSKGFQVAQDPEFASSQGMRRLKISKNGQHTEIDMISDYRHDSPVRNARGLVLSLPDAVANKITALADRGEARDYLDALTIRNSHVYTDDQLQTIINERFRGFEWQRLISALRFMDHIPDRSFRAYVSQNVIDRDRVLAHQWVKQLQQKYGVQDYRLVPTDDVAPLDPRWAEKQAGEEQSTLHQERKRHHRLSR